MLKSRARVVAAFLEDRDPRAGRGQHRGGDAAARAAADDDEVDLDRRRVGELGAGDDAAGAVDRVAHGATSGGCGTDGRARVADERVDLGRRIVGGVGQPLERLVAAAQEREARAPPGLEARVLLGGRRARERPRRAGGERADEAALEEAQQPAKVVRRRRGARWPSARRPCRRSRAPRPAASARRRRRRARSARRPPPTPRTRRPRAAAAARAARSPGASCGRRTAASRRRAAARRRTARASRNWRRSSARALVGPGHARSLAPAEDARCRTG